MKKLTTIPIHLILLSALILIMQSCSDVCVDTRSMIYYEPVYMSLPELRNSISNVSEQRQITNPGKIYYLNQKIFINQPNEGLHVIDNADPNSPQYLTFIEIPGNFDLAGTGNYLFVDSYIDLVVLDISDVNNAQEKARVKNYFPSYNSYGYYTDPDKGVVTGWTEVETIDEFTSDCNGSGYYINDWGWGRYSGGVVMDMALAAPSVNVAGSGSPGVGGSLATFTLNGGRLFTITQNDLSSVNVTSPENPMIELSMNIGWGLETLFPYEDKIFIGASNGMHIVDVSNPLQPELLSTYSHIVSCDPVVVQGDYAYVTLRDGTGCRNGANLLEVVDISNPESPTMVSSFPMYNPGGLGIDGETLFVCDGDAGLKVFNAADVNNITSFLIKSYPEIIAIDVIPFNNILMVIAKDGYHQFDYSNPYDMKLMSTIEMTYDL